MNTRFGILLFYLLMCCVTLQQVFPWTVQGDQIEFCENAPENESPDSKGKKESFNEWKTFRDGDFAEVLSTLGLLAHNSDPATDSDIIPDSAFRSIFSPPPNKG